MRPYVHRERGGELEARGSKADPPSLPPHSTLPHPPQPCDGQYGDRCYPVLSMKRGVHDRLSYFAYNQDSNMAAAVCICFPPSFPLAFYYYKWYTLYFSKSPNFFILCISDANRRCGCAGDSWCDKSGPHWCVKAERKWADRVGNGRVISHTSLHTSLTQALTHIFVVWAWTTLWSLVK